MEEKSFNAAFQNVYDVRVQQVSCARTMSNQEYKKHTEKAVRLFYRIADLLGEDKQHLIYEYEEQIALADSYGREYSYKQGFIDGILFTGDKEEVV